MDNVLRWDMDIRSEKWVGAKWRCQEEDVKGDRNDEGRKTQEGEEVRLLRFERANNVAVPLC